MRMQGEKEGDEGAFWGGHAPQDSHFTGVK